MRTAQALILAGAAFLGGCGTVTEYLGGKDNIEPPAELEPIDEKAVAEILWQRDVGVGQGGQHVRLAPVLGGANIYVASHDGKVEALSLQTGVPVWTVDLDAPLSGGPGHGDGLVVVGSSDGAVYALEDDTGEERWRARVSSEVLAAPASARGMVVVRALDGRLFGFSAETGKRRWTYDQSVPVLTLRGTSAPVVVGNVVVQGSDGGRLVALALEGGRLVWEQRVTVPRGRSELERIVDIDADPKVLGDAIYVVTYQGRIAALDLSSGRTLWQRDMSSHAGLSVDDKAVYVTDDESHVWALDRFTSASLWRQTALHARALTAPAKVGDLVVVGDFEGFVHWLNPETGQFVARHRVDDSGIAASPVAAGEVALLWSADGKLVAARAR